MLHDRAGQFTAIIACAICFPAQAEFEYQLKILPLLDGFSESLAMGVNDEGTVTGSIGTPSTYHQAAAWFDDEVTVLTGVGISGATARGINTQGTIVGRTDAFEGSAYQWHDGGVSQLATPAFCCGEAWSINDSGVICGNIPSEGFGSRHACIWIDGQWQLLEAFGTSSSVAYSINVQGQIVGTFALGNGQTRGCIWNDGMMTELPVPDEFFGSVLAMSINAHGRAVGYGAGRAMTWMENEVQELTPLAPEMPSYANDLNDDGIIVGASYGTGLDSTHACRWVDGQVEDLNALVDRGEWVLYEAVAINNSGVISGTAFSSQVGRRAFLLEPSISHCPEDIDGDGVVGVDDLLILLGGFGTGDDGDIDEDGDTDVNDVLLLLAVYGTICEE